MLEGKVALVTGASRGIGRAATVALAKIGATVAVNYKTHAEEAEAVSREIQDMGGRAVAIQADVSITADVARMLKQVESQLGPVAVLVNNAGITRPQPIHEITEQDWDEVLAVNLKSVFPVTQAVLPDMRAAKWGRIINISSVAAQTGGVIGLHYAASKAGIIGLTHSYAALLAKEGITVNAIAPAPIETDMISEPVIVGGSPEKRGVVSAANYVAPKYGVHGAMPAVTAHRLCPYRHEKGVVMRDVLKISFSRMFLN